MGKVMLNVLRDRKVDVMKGDMRVSDNSIK